MKPKKGKVSINNEQKELKAKAKKQEVGSEDSDEEYNSDVSQATESDFESGAEGSGAEGSDAQNSDADDGYKVNLEQIVQLILKYLLLLASLFF